MKLTPLGIEGAWVAESPIWSDDRGFFREWFKSADIDEATGRSFGIEQANISHSSKGTLRGIHYSIAPQGQGKLVTVMSGSIDDYVMDVRPSSPTFGNWEKVRLDSRTGGSLLLSPNLGHAFQALEKDTIVSYLVTAEFNPEAEKGITPFCPKLAIEWDSTIAPLVSQKDNDAPTLEDQLKSKNLPN